MRRGGKRVGLHIQVAAMISVGVGGAQDGTYILILPLQGIGVVLGESDEVPQLADVELELLEVVRLALAVLDLGPADLHSAVSVLFLGRLQRWR